MSPSWLGNIVYRIAYRRRAYSRTPHPTMQQARVSATIDTSVARNYPCGCRAGSSSTMTDSDNGEFAAWTDSVLALSDGRCLIGTADSGFASATDFYQERDYVDGGCVSGYRIRSKRLDGRRRRSTTWTSAIADLPDVECDDRHGSSLVDRHVRTRR
jgi:hypothetical protein